MLHYHGTPITPKASIEAMKGKHMCISFSDPRDADWSIKNAQSIMWDNGAFSSYTKGKPFKKDQFIAWLDDKLYAANWAVIPDVIDGTVSEQREMAADWPYPKHLSAMVWHMGLSLDWLREIIDNYPRFCFGSSGEYWKVGGPDWCRRADEAWDIIEKSNARPWVHMMRGLKLSKGRWPFASADSTNVARHFKEREDKCPKQMSDRIDAVQPPIRFEIKQRELNI